MKKKQKSLKIEKGVPPPQRRGRPAQYPWRTLKIGESFVTDEPDFMIGNANVRYAPKRFTSQKEDKGTRIWRVK